MGASASAEGKAEGGTSPRGTGSARGSLPYSFGSWAERSNSRRNRPRARSLSASLGEVPLESRLASIAAERERDIEKLMRKYEKREAEVAYAYSHGSPGALEKLSGYSSGPHRL